MELIQAIETAQRTGQYQSEEAKEWAW